MDKNGIFEYLDNLRECGICNMYESGKFVREEFGLKNLATGEQQKVDFATLVTLLQ